jgi:hypothetical protein
MKSLLALRSLRRCCLTALLLLAASSEAATELVSARLEQGEGVVTLTFSLTDRTREKVFTLTEPDRLVIDLMDASAARGVFPVDVGASPLVRAVRQGLQADGRLRLVLDLAEPVAVAEQRWLGGGAAPVHALQLTFSPGPAVASGTSPPPDSLRQVEANEAAAPSRAGTPENADGPAGADTRGTASGDPSGVLVFDAGRSSAASAEEAAPASRRWRPRLDRGLVEAGSFSSDRVRRSGNLHAQAIATVTGDLTTALELRLGGRFDAHLQGGELDSPELAEAELDETWLRLRRDGLRVTVGAQRIIWGRTDEISPTDRLSTRDFTRLVLDDLPDRRRVNPALRVEWLREDWGLDLVYLPTFREAVLPDPESIWFPVDTQSGSVAGLALPDAVRPLLRDARVRNEASGDGGAGLRFKHYGDALDYAVTVQRVRNPEPYFALGAVEGSRVVLDTVYPRSWVAGGDLGLALGAWTLRAEGAWLSDVAYTGNDLALRTTGAANWVVGGEVFPGDRNLRFTVQLTGTHLLDAGPALDRKNILGLTGELEGPFAGGRWRGQFRYWYGLDSEDLYLNPELVFTGWEPSEFYLGLHLFQGERGTNFGFYDRADMIVIGWRGRF